MANYFVLEYSPGEYSESMTTDVLVEQFDFAQFSEADLDKVTANARIGQEFSFICKHGGSSYVQVIRRVS